MRIHHVNVASMCPRGKWWIDGEGGLFEETRLVSHALIVETTHGIVAVETGLGTLDVAAPLERLPRRFTMVSRPAPSRDETLLAHVERLGFRRGDVRHIVLTHLDVDHAGGLPDFPDAKVHLSAAEHADAVLPRRDGRMRYVPAQWAHGPRWVTHAAGGEGWFGFDAVRALADDDGEVSPDILLVPLPGHSVGHSGVAVRGEHGWILHAGDAFFHHREMDVDAPSCPPGLALFQWMLQADGAARRRNQERLRGLIRAHGAEVRVINAHDPTFLAASVRPSARDRASHGAARCIPLPDAPASHPRSRCG